MNLLYGLFNKRAVLCVYCTNMNAYLEVHLNKFLTVPFIFNLEKHFHCGLWGAACCKNILPPVKSVKIDDGDVKRGFSDKWFHTSSCISYLKLCLKEKSSNNKCQLLIVLQHSVFWIDVCFKECFDTLENGIILLLAKLD